MHLIDLAEDGKTATYRRSRFSDVRRLNGHLLLALAVVLSVALAADTARTGDVAVYHAGGQAARGTGNVYGFLFGPHGFTYPPFAALVFDPFASLPVPVLWCVLNAASLVALAGMLRVVAPDTWARARAGELRACALFAGLALSEPIVNTLQFGQVDILLTALVVVDLLVIRRGYLIGLATAFKLTPGLFIVFLLLRRRYREAATAAAVFAATIIGSSVLLPSASHTYWTHNVFLGTGTGGFTGADNQSIHGLALRVLGTHAGGYVWALLVVPTLVFGLGAAQRAARCGHEVLAVGAVGLTACLVSPLSWVHHWVWLLPMLVGLVNFPHSDATRWRHLPPAFLVYTVLWSLIPSELQSSPGIDYLGNGFAVLGIFTLAMVWVVTTPAQQRRRP